MIEPLGVPCGGDAVADEEWPWCCEGDKLVRIYGQIAGVFAAELGFGGAIFHEVSGHPVVLASSEALDGFAEVSAQKRGAAFTRGADQAYGEAWLKRHCDQRGFAVARDTFDADVFCVDGRIGFEIVEAACCAPCPCAESAPVFRLAWLALVDQTDDASSDASAVVGLNARGVDGDVAPAVGDQLLCRWRIACGAWAEGGKCGGW